LRPRLAFLADLFGDLARSARRRRADEDSPRPKHEPQESETELRSAEEVKRRLDETRDRLKREAPRDGPPS